MQLVENDKYRLTILSEIDGVTKDLFLFDIQHELKKLIKTLQEGKATTVILSFYNVTELLEKIKKCFKKHIIAAGGVVRNSKNDILFIYRNGFWDLPKGKVEPNEDIAATAVREVIEETGMNNVELKRALKTTFHTYKELNVLVLKETRWYEMFSDDNNLNPQTEEGISELKWVATNEIDVYCHKSYPNIQVLLNDYMQQHN